MGIFLGLVAAISLGLADFMARFATRAVGTYRTLLYMQPLGLIGLSIYWIASGLILKPGGSASWQAWALAVLVVLLNLLSTLAFYRSLHVGTVSIVSPIVASYAAIVVLLSMLSGERLSLSHGLGISTVLIGVVLTATTLPHGSGLNPHDRNQGMPGRWTQGVWLAIAAALGYGVTTWLLGVRVIPLLGPIAPVWLIRLITPCILVASAGPLRQNLHLPRGRAWWFVGSIALFDTVGYVAATNGLATEQIAIVGVLISLFSAVTILLAWIFLRERLQWSQWLGVGIIFGGIVLINL